MKPRDLTARDAMAWKIESAFKHLHSEALRGSLKDENGRWLNPYAMTGNVKCRKIMVSNVSAVNGTGTRVDTPTYHVLIEVSSRRSEHLSAVKEACEPLIQQIKEHLTGGEELWMQFACFGLAEFTRHDPYTVTLPMNSIEGSFTRRWDTTEDWQEPRLRRELEVKIRKHGISVWRIVRMPRSVGLVLYNDSDFIMGKMLF